MHPRSLVHTTMRASSPRQMRRIMPEFAADSNGLSSVHGRDLRQSTTVHIEASNDPEIDEFSTGTAVIPDRARVRTATCAADHRRIATRAAGRPGGAGLPFAGRTRNGVDA